MMKVQFIIIWLPAYCTLLKQEHIWGKKNAKQEQGSWWSHIQFHFRQKQSMQIYTRMINIPGVINYTENWKL